MAEGLFKKQLGQEAANWRVESAGTWAPEGFPVSRRTDQLLQSRGVILRRSGARIVSRDLLSSFNLILVMEKGHKEALSVEFPELAGRIYLLSEMAGKEIEIADPMGGSQRDFEATADELEALLQAGMGRIRELADGE
jgi:protein-tyrosine phosphatase